MLKIINFTCENINKDCVTDNERPRFSFATESDYNGATLKKAKLCVNDWILETTDQIALVYGGTALKANSEYTAKLYAENDKGENAVATLNFRTGLLNEKWQGEWITDGSYKFTEKKTSPTPMTFKKQFSCRKKIKSAYIYATALGIYDIILNNKKVGENYFAPGFTTYKKNLQYQYYNITSSIGDENVISAVVGGGWAVGAFVMNRKNRIAGKRQAFLAEIHITYADDSTEIIKTDESWSVTLDGKLKFAEFYDGEYYDASFDEKNILWKKASKENIKICPEIKVTYGTLVKAQEIFKPIAVTVAKNGEIIYDFGRNFAGVVKLQINGVKGQRIVVRHAEILTENGELNTAFLRSAKCELTYICKDGVQEYSPTMTYMGFRYASIKGVSPSDVSIEGIALYSDIVSKSEFLCSNEDINKLQSNIVWSGKSNFVDIPTDCPQRDERMGWTGDVAVFASTACCNFNMSRFFNKWLKDAKAEQTAGGGLPNTIPSNGYGFPLTMPKKAVAFWGDACIFVPWAQYLAYGDKSVLSENYAMMKKYVKACFFWANIGFGKNRYIWNDIPALQFGDWLAPDVSSMSAWQARCKWTGTSALAASSGILSKIAKILGDEKSSEYYLNLKQKVSDAYNAVLTDGNGKLKKEFQTGYVLPLYFDMFPPRQKSQAVKNLVSLIEKNNYNIGTGFPGTPYILFVLADNKCANIAYKMLLNKNCPSWLYEVKMGATTIWERWDGIRDNTAKPIGADGAKEMVSFNHYAFGAVGDFFYRRICGVEQTSGGYKTFMVKPIIGGNLTWAKAVIETTYGKIASSWKKSGDEFTITVEVPMSTSCILVMPSGKEQKLNSGKHTFSEPYFN